MGHYSLGLDSFSICNLLTSEQLVLACSEYFVTVVAFRWNHIELNDTAVGTVSLNDHYTLNCDTDHVEYEHF